MINDDEQSMVPLAGLGFGFLLWMLFLGQASWAQSIREFNGVSHMVMDGTWYMLENGQPTFAVDTTTLTIKAPAVLKGAQWGALQRQYGLQPLQRNRLGYRDVIVTESDIFTAADALVRSGQASAVYLNYLGRYTDEPNDPRFPSQWHHARIGTPDLWSQQWGGREVIVAVIDSGFDVDHPDFGSLVNQDYLGWTNPGEDVWLNPGDPTSGNGLDDDGNGLVDDWLGFDFFHSNNNVNDINGHGTFVSGLLAGKTNNGIGIAGVVGGFGGAGVRVMALAVGDASPSTAALDDAILYALDKGAHVLQMSLTVPYSPPVEAALINASQSSNIVMVCSSGNDGGNVGYPARNPAVIAVGATDAQDMRASFSNYGSDLDLCAPGTSLRSTELDSNYGLRSGTSFAAPLVSGTVAAILSHNPNLTRQQVRNLLLATAEPTGSYDYNWDSGKPGHALELGFGRLNMFAAVLQSAGTNSDLFLSRHPWDTGREPAARQDVELLAASAIWNCVEDPQCTAHQDPVPGRVNRLRVAIGNRSAFASPQGELSLFWSLARTQTRWPDHWLHPDDPRNPGENRILNVPTGGRITVRREGSFDPQPIVIPPLAVGERVILSKDWLPPSLANIETNLGPTTPSWGLLARIQTSEDPVMNENFGLLTHNIQRSNNHAARVSRQISLHTCDTDSGNHLLVVTNAGAVTESFDVDLVLADTDQPFLPRVELSLSDPAWEDWPAQNANMAGLLLVGDSRYVVENPTDGATLRNITLANGESRLMQIRFILSDQKTPQRQTFRMMVSQTRTSNGEVQGGHFFEIDVMGDPLLQGVPQWPATNVTNLVQLVCDPSGFTGDHP